MSPASNDQVMGALGDLLGALVGGHPEMQTPGRAPSRRRRKDSDADPLGSLITQVLGGGDLRNNPIANVLAQPITDMLVQRTGMDRKTAQTVVIFALTTLVSAASQKATRKGLNVNDLVSELSSSGQISQSYLTNSGMAAELSEQSGLDPQTSAESLQQVFSALGTQMGTAKMQGRQTARKSHLKKRK